MSDFSTELERAKQDGVTLPENLPFLFKPERPNGQALLLIHGFGASPHEMRPVAEHLCARGYLTLGTRLAGHGTSPEDLRFCRWQDWYGSVARSYSTLIETGLPVSLIGQSTGALLGLALAHQRRIERLALLSPFLKLSHPLANLAGLIKYMIPFQQRQLPHPEHLHYYERRPLTGIEQIGLLRNRIEQILHKITVPTLVIAAEGDQTVASGTGRELFEKLGSSLKEFHLFGPEVPHALSTANNPELNATCRLINNFLDGTNPQTGHNRRQTTR
jgi:carboxylesterase